MHGGVCSASYHSCSASRTALRCLWFRTLPDPPVLPTPRLRMSSNAASSSVLPVVIVGAGLAGLTVALHLARERRVIVLAKRNLDEAATAWAQGGIVGVLGDDDSVDSHVRDTQEAGAGLVDEHTARFIAERSAGAVEWLVERGVPFSPDPGGPIDRKSVV